MSSRSKFYPLGDQPSPAERRALGALAGVWNHGITAVSAREFRKPRKGEWYLSGAIVTAYRAPNDLPSAYHIARLVRIKWESVPHIMAGPIGGLAS